MHVCTHNYIRASRIRLHLEEPSRFLDERLRIANPLQHAVPLSHCRSLPKTRARSRSSARVAAVHSRERRAFQPEPSCKVLRLALENEDDVQTWLQRQANTGDNCFYRRPLMACIYRPIHTLFCACLCARLSVLWVFWVWWSGVVRNALRSVPVCVFAINL